MCQHLPTACCRKAEKESFLSLLLHQMEDTVITKMSVQGSPCWACSANSQTPCVNWLGLRAAAPSRNYVGAGLFTSLNVAAKELLIASISASKLQISNWLH